MLIDTNKTIKITLEKKKIGLGLPLGLNLLDQIMLND